MSYYEENGELVSTDDTSFTLNDTKYRITVRVRHKHDYHVYVGLYKIQGSTPYDRLHSRTYRAPTKSDVRSRAEAGTKEMREFAEEREDARGLRVNVEVSEGA